MHFVLYICGYICYFAQHSRKDLKHLVRTCAGTASKFRVFLFWLVFYIKINNLHSSTNTNVNNVSVHMCMFMCECKHTQLIPQDYLATLLLKRFIG